MSAMTRSTNCFTSGDAASRPTQPIGARDAPARPAKATRSLRLSSQRLVAWLARRVNLWPTKLRESSRSRSRLCSRTRDSRGTFRRGRLTSALRSGFGPLEHAPGKASPDDEHNPAKTSAKEGALQATDGRLRRRREVAERVLRDAETAASDAILALKEQQDGLARLERERDKRRANVSALEQELDKARTAASASEDDVRQAQKARREAEQALHNARERITQAERGLGGLPNP